MATVSAAEPETLLGASDIAHRIEQMARDIVLDFGDELILLVLTEGGFVFAADLLRALGRAGGRIDVRFGSAELSGLKAQRVLAVDAAMNTGRTALRALDRARETGAAEVRLAVLVDRPSRAGIGLTPDYAGFIVPDRWLVGYGLEDGGRGRERADLAALP